MSSQNAELFYFKYFDTDKGNLTGSHLFEEAGGLLRARNECDLSLLLSAKLLEENAKIYKKKLWGKRKVAIQHWHFSGKF